MLACLVLAVTAGVAAGSDRFQRLPSIAITPKEPRGFDISWVENSSGKYFFADRTNKAVDLVNATNDAFLGPIGAGLFTGVVSPCAGGGNVCSGPDGVLTDSHGNVWVGDGDSTIKVLSRTPNTGSGALIKTIPTCPASSGVCGATGGRFRADEEAYDPVDHLILIANDAEGFVTFIHVDEDNPKNSSVAGHFFYSDNTLDVAASAKGHSTAGAGIEQSVWVPKTGLFYQAVPANSPDTVGFIDVFDPVGMKLVATFSVPGCTNGPTGLAFGSGNRFLGACDNGAADVDLRGVVRKIVPDVGGADEIWFNPGDDNYYLGISGPPARVGVVNNGDHVVAVLAGPNGGSVGGHSVAAYAVNNHIFAPDRTGTRGVDVFVDTSTD
jgi:hypothetical protein